jgi:hypothetical protein
MGSGSRSPPVGAMDVEVPKQYMVKRIIGKSCMAKNKISWESSGSNSSVG